LEGVWYRPVDGLEEERYMRADGTFTGHWDDGSVDSIGEYVILPGDLLRSSELYSIMTVSPPNIVTITAIYAAVESAAYEFTDNDHFQLEFPAIDGGNPVIRRYARIRPS
jgi:hypothetical protein